MNTSKLKDKFSNFNNVYGIIILTFIILMIKSICFLAMLRTPSSITIDFGKTYFQSPPLLAHIAFITVLLSFGFLFKKRRKEYCLVIDILVSIMLLVDIWYFRANGAFLSVRQLLHKELFNPLDKNLVLPAAVDLIFFIDIIILLILVISQAITKRDMIKSLFVDVKRRWILFVATFVASIAIIAGSHYYIDVVDGTHGEKMLFRITWAPFQTMSNLSPLGYHYYDIYKYGFNQDETKLTNSDKEKINNWLQANKEELPDNKYKGMFKDKNVIAVQVESLENFVIGQKVYGQEITPNLNKMLANSLYFDNIYEQNNSGTSSDADLMVNTSILPVRKGATAYEFPWANLPSMPQVLAAMGYTTVSAHAEEPGSWNWAETHKGIYGFEESLDIHQFNKDEVIGLGLSDGSFMTQIAHKLKNVKQPFYNFFATLTSHGPFDMPEKYKYLDLPKEFDDTILGAYFQSVRYVDEQIANFIKELKSEGLLDNTVFMIYGDHTGVHKFYNDKLKDIKLEGDWWKNVDMKIPFIIYNPEISGETINVAGGQIDFYPTIAYLLGVDESKFEGKVMGRILVNTNRDSSILNSGKVAGNPRSKEEEDHVKQSLDIANKIITGNYYKNNNAK